MDLGTLGRLEAAGKRRTHWDASSDVKKGSCGLSLRTVEDVYKLLFAKRTDSAADGSESTLSDIMAEDTWSSHVTRGGDDDDCDSSQIAALRTSLREKMSSCNMYDCFIIPPRMNVNLFMNTTS
jgi:hypothetical protein